MTREEALSQVAPNLSYFNDCKIPFAISECKSWINKIFDDHDAQIKAKDEKIERLKIRLKLIKEWSDVNEKIILEKDEEIKELGEIVQQYLIPSKNYDAIIKAKDEEIDMLKKAMQEFVNRCEKGEVRSSYTYAKFKELLKVKQ